MSVASWQKWNLHGNLFWSLWTLSARALALSSSIHRFRQRAFDKGFQIINSSFDPFPLPFSLTPAPADLNWIAWITSFFLAVSFACQVPHLMWHWTLLRCICKQHANVSAANWLTHIHTHKCTYIYACSCCQMNSRWPCGQNCKQLILFQTSS